VWLVGVAAALGTGNLYIAPTVPEHSHDVAEHYHHEMDDRYRGADAERERGEISAEIARNRGEVNAEIARLMARLNALEADLERVDAAIEKLDDTHPPKTLTEELNRIRQEQNQIRTRIRALEAK